MLHIYKKIKFNAKSIKKLINKSILASKYTFDRKNDINKGIYANNIRFYML